MKKPILTRVVAISMLLAASVGAQELFSVNIWGPGRANQGPGTEYTQESWLRTLRIEDGQTAGVWETDEWQNIAIQTVALNGTVGLTGSDGGTATFRLLSRRGQSAYRWTFLRNGTTDPTVNAEYMANGNATLLDGKLVGTQFDGPSGPVDPTKNAVIEVSDIPFPVYDVIIYFSMNFDQFGAGTGNAGRGYINFNNTGLTEYFLPVGTDANRLLPTTFTEIENSGDTGNFIRYTNVTGSSFTARVYGHGFNHGGIAGFQIQEVEVIAGAVDPDVSTVTASPVFVPADGTGTSTITVSLRDNGNVPVADKEVTLAGSTGNAVIDPTTPVTTDAAGLAVFTVSSTTPGTEVFTATNITDDDMVITQTASVNFVGDPDADESTISASPAVVVANGITPSTIALTAVDANGFPVAGSDVTLAAVSGPGAPVITPANATTNASGVATFSVSSDTIGTVEFQATADGVVILQLAEVEFIDPGIALAFNVNFSRSHPSNPGPTSEVESQLFGPAGGLGERWNQYAASTSSGLVLDSEGVGTAVTLTTDFSEGRYDGTGAIPMLRSTLTDFGRGTQRTLTINGLPPGALFDVWLTGFRNQPTTNERVFARWTANNATSSPSVQFVDNRDGVIASEFVEGYNYTVFRTVVADENGSISFIGKGMTTADGADQDYRLGLSGLQLTPVGEALITSFGIPGSDGVIDQENKTISLTVPFDTDLSTLAPTFTLTSGVATPASGTAPSPSFAVQNPATYTVTDDNTDPITVNEYLVTVILEDPPIPTTTLVIDLGAGTVIPGGQSGIFGATNLPLPELPVGSILRSISVDAVLVDSTQFNFASDLAVLIDPTPDDPGGDFSLGIYSGTPFFGSTLRLTWPGEAEKEDLGTPLVDVKTEGDWASLGLIDLATNGLFIGNAFGAAPESGTWSGTITLTFDLVDPSGPGDSPFADWAGGAAFDGDASGDGVANGLAFLLGAASPASNALGLLPAPESTTEGLVLTFRMRNAAARGAAGLTVQWSSDLGITDPWAAQSALVPETSGTVNGVVFVITPNGALNDVTATIPASQAENGKLFARLFGTQD